LLCSDWTAPADSTNARTVYEIRDVAPKGSCFTLLVLCTVSSTIKPELSSLLLHLPYTQLLRSLFHHRHLFLFPNRFLFALSSTSLPAIRLDSSRLIRLELRGTSRKRAAHCSSLLSAPMMTQTPLLVTESDSFPKSYVVLSNRPLAFLTLL
jgi:hypothetical protein